MEDQAETKLYILFALNQLPIENAHHKFELICFNLTKENIRENVIPSTGPVARYGDQGRDFLSFKTYLDGTLNNNSNFLGINPLGNTEVFTCSIERNIISKIKADVQLIVDYGLPVDVIFFFARENIVVGKTNVLKLWALKKNNVELEIFDGNAIADLLARAKNHWIAKRFLNISHSLLNPLELALFFDNGGIKKTIEFSTNIKKQKLLTLGDLERREKKLDIKTIITILEKKSFLQEKVDEYNKKNIDYHRNKEIRLFLFNRGNGPCNNIDLTVLTTLQKGYKIRHETQISKPYIPLISSYSRNNLNIMHALESVSQLRNNSTKNYPFYYENLEIDKEDCGENNKWKIKYHIDNLRHNDSVRLEPIKLFVPQYPKIKELIFDYTFKQEEQGTIKPQELKIILTEN